jgi:hypothetical protein
MTELAMIGQDVEVFHPGNTTNYSKLPVEYAVSFRRNFSDLR